jgi:hypothetical protein
MRLCLAEKEQAGPQGDINPNAYRDYTHTRSHDDTLIPIEIRVNELAVKAKDLLDSYLVHGRALLPGF